MADIDALSDSITQLVGDYSLTRDELADFMTGPADGGPSGDGMYPVTLANGTDRIFVPSPKKLAEMVGEGGFSYATRETMATSADPSALTAIVVSDGTYTWRDGDLAALINAEPANFVASIRAGSPVGAWVRVPGEGNFSSLAALKLGTFVVGQNVAASVYGNSRWICRDEVILQNHFSGEPLQSSKVDFDDELHLVVDLASGGTGILECQPASIQGHIANEVTRLYAAQYNRFERKLSLATVGSIFCYGDSISYGQIAPQLFGDAQIPTGYGDGSKHAWTQIAGAWPAVLLSLLAQVHGGGKMAVTNRGYSGDRVGSAYKRHRGAGSGGQTISMIAYGTNDTLFGSSNGQAPEQLFTGTDGFTFDRFTPALRKFAYREVLRGSLPILACPYVWSSLQGYDGTTYAAGKIAGAFRMAIRAVADEIGAGFVDWSSIINARSVGVLTHDGVHPNAAGHLAIAARTVPLLMGKGWRYRTDIYGPTKLMALPHVENITGPATSGANDLPLVANAGSFGKPFVDATQAGDLVIAAGEKRFIAFYSHTDEMALMPVGYAAAGASLTYSLNFGDEQGSARLNCRRGAAKGVPLALPSSRQISNPGSGTRDFNHPGVTRDHLVIQGRGWHVLTLSAEGGAIVLSGVAFDARMGEIGPAIASPVLAAAIVAPTNGPMIDAEARATISALIASNRQLENQLSAVLDVLRDQSRIAS